MTANGTIFKTLSLDRSKVQWESYLDELTPVQQGDSGMWYKREDWFAPLGYGGINGAKLRQCIWLLHRASRQVHHELVISAGSVKSPQHAMVATICRHLGMKSAHVVGGTKPSTADRHDSIQIARRMGATFDYIGVGYNPALQARLKDIHKELPRAYKLEYAISLDHSTHAKSEIQDFHNVGAWQVANLPEGLTDIIIPAGSCNSCCSVLWGLFFNQRRPHLNIHLIGIGHDRTSWLFERLKMMGADIRPAESVDYPRWTMFLNWVEHDIYFHDLIGQGYTDYQQMWKESLDGIVGHPTYEAKCFRYLKYRRPDMIHERALFWVVGSEPKLAPMLPYLPQEHV